MPTEVILTKFEGDIADFEAKISTASKSMERFDDAREGAEKSTKEFGGSIGSATDRLKNLRREAGPASKGIEDVGKTAQSTGGLLSGMRQELDNAFPIFGKIANGAKVMGRAIYVALGPVGIAVAALVAVFAALAKVFFGTERGSEALGRVLEPLKAIFAALLGVAQRVSFALADAFNDPQQAVKDLWEVIKTNIVNRIAGVADTFVALRKVIQGAIDLDWDAMQEGAAEARESVVQSLTGVDDFAGKAQAAIQGLGREISVAAEKGARIHEIKEELEELAITIAENEARINREFQEQLRIVDDVNATAEERKAAGEEAIRLQKELAALKLQELNLQIEELEVRQSLNDTSDQERLELAKLKAARDQVLADELAGTRDVQRRMNRINKQVADQAIREAQRAAAEREKLEEDREKAALDAEAIVAKAREEQFQRTLSQQELLERQTTLRYENEIAAARKAFAALKELTPEGEREAIARQEAEAIEAIEQNLANTIGQLRRKSKDEEQALREENLEKIEEALATEEELRTAAIEKRYEELEELARATITDQLELTATLLEIEAQRDAAFAEQRQAAAEAELERFYAENEEKIALMEGVAGQLEGVVQQLAEGQLKTAADVGKALVSIALDTLEKMIMMSIAENMARRVAEKGIVGVAEGLAMTVLIKGIFAAVKAQVQGAYTGERNIGSNGERPIWSGKDGYLRRVHKGEDIIAADKARKYRPALDAIHDGTFDEFLGGMAYNYLPEGLASPEWSRTMQALTFEKPAPVHNYKSEFNDRNLVGAMSASINEEKRMSHYLERIDRHLSRKSSRRYK